MPDWRPALRARLASVPLPDTRKAELVDELAYHLDEYCDDLRAGGLSIEEAVRATLVELERASLLHTRLAPSPATPRTFGDLRVSWLDLTLGVRIWLKHPALSLVSVIGMALATAIGAAYFAGFATMLDPSLPFDEGDRIVSIENVDVRRGSDEDRILHDFLTWRDELRSVDDLAAMRIEDRNLIGEAQRTRLVRVAKITASGFRVTRVAPLLGRLLVDADERPDAPPVLLIAEEVWQNLFDRDAGILGRSVQLGRTKHTIVGVMPAGFRFPLDNQFWVPFQTDPGGYAPRSGPSIHVFGRLADGLSIEAAEAELSTIGARLAAENDGLRPQVLPYAYPFNGLDNFAVAWWVRVAQFAIGLLVAVVAVNVAILVYARTAARTGEIAVRTALGASRRRIVVQLFLEALVLSSVAATLGLTIAGIALWIAQDVVVENPSMPLPFWVDLGLSPGTAAYVAGLAIMAAIIVGVVPGLKATGRRLQTGLQQMSSRASHPTLGRLWTALIVAQVAIAVAVLPFALYVTGVLLRGSDRQWHSADGLLTASLALQPDDVLSMETRTADTAADEYRKRVSQLLHRLEAEPTFAGVTFAGRFPGYEGLARFEVEPSVGDSATNRNVRAEPITVVVRSNHIDTDFFDVLGVPVLEGRGFGESDARDGSNPILVNRAFAERVLGGSDALGVRVRCVIRIARRAGSPAQVETGPWLRIVGVVPNIAVKRDLDPEERALVYEAAAAAAAPVPLHLMVRVRNTGPDAAERLRSLASQIDAGLQLGQLRTAADVEREATQWLGYVAWAVAAVTFSVLLLSAAGIYAMTSFTVARRQREIGIRTALGASPRRLLAGIFARTSAQLGAGVLAGLVLAAGLDRLVGDALGDRRPVLLPAVAALMVMVGLLAALGPARRGLAVQPIDALRED
jgi:predicted permease